MGESSLKNIIFDDRFHSIDFLFFRLIHHNCSLVRSHLFSSSSLGSHNPAWLCYSSEADPTPCTCGTSGRCRLLALSIITPCYVQGIICQPPCRSCIILRLPPYYLNECWPDETRSSGSEGPRQDWRPGLALNNSVEYTSPWLNQIESQKASSNKTTRSLGRIPRALSCTDSRA